VQSRWITWRRCVLWGATAPALMFLLWSCTSHRLETPKPAPTGESAQYREINPNRAVDILFVVDNSGSMREEQANLARNFPVFMQELATLQGGDFRIGVTNTDLGGGAVTANAECAMFTPGGDRGLFCSMRGQDLCQTCGVDVSQGRFLRTVNPNFQGTLPNVFSCIAMYGTAGCSFEHSIGALRNALTLPENGQFIRPEAYLAFVLITDEEDCTAPPDSQMFATPNPVQDWSLRCYTESVVCNGSHPSGAMATDFALNECQVANDGQLTRLDELINAVLAVKNNDPSMIISAGIFGWPLPGQEATARHRIRAAGAGTFGMQPVCNSGNGSATPGYRVKSFVEAFPNHATYSICQDDFREAMTRLGQKIVGTVGPSCVPLVDISQDAGLQADCSVTERIPNGSGGFEDTIVPPCSTNPGVVCWNAVQVGGCTGPNYLVEINRQGAMAPTGTQQTIRCLTTVN
jgi:hypothetical protein